MNTVALFVYDELKYADILNEFFQCNITYQNAYVKDQILCVDDKGEYFLQNKEDSTVEGSLLVLLQEQIWKIDQWKELQSYTREEHTVFVGTGSSKAWVYNKKGICLRSMPVLEENMEQKERLQTEIKEFKDQVAVSSYPISDLYIFIPCNIDKAIDYSNEKHIPIIAEHYIRQLNLVSAYEFDSNLTNNIKRSFLDEVEVICESDEFVDKSELGRQNVNLFVTWHPNTNIAIITVAIPVISVSVTHILDQMARGEIFVKDKNRNINKINIIEWLKDAYGLSQVGSPRAYVNLSRPPDTEMEMLYLLATEAIGNKVYSKIMGRNFKEAARSNIAQYEYSDIYAAETCVVQVFKEFADTYEMRLIRQILTIFSMELILFQDAAISRVNRKVAAELEMQQLSEKDAFNVIEKMSMEFARTIVFWDLRNFRYQTTQSVADSIIRAFKIKEQMDVYKENKDFLQHLITIHSARMSEQENRSLNNILMFLTICQVAPVFYSITLCLLEGEVVASNLIAAAISTSSFILILLVLKLLVSKRR